MPSNTSDREIAAERAVRAWNLRQQGWTQRRIAAALGVDQGTVSRLLAKVYKRALARLDKRAAQERAVQVEQLNHIADEALQAWERSKRPKKRSSQRDGGNGRQTTLEAEDRDGDPSFLAAAMSALAQVRELLALNVTTADTSSAVDLRSALLAAEASDDAYPADEPSPPEPPPECPADPSSSP